MMREDFRPNLAFDEPILPLEKIQGNTIPGFNKDHQILLGLQIKDAQLAKQWLRTVIPYLSTAEDVLNFNRIFSRISKRIGQDGKWKTGLVATWTNIAFSFTGLEKLGKADVF